MHMCFHKIFFILCTTYALSFKNILKENAFVLRYECFFRKDFISLWYLKCNNLCWLFSSFLKAEKSTQFEKMKFRAKSCKIVQLKWKWSKNVHLKVFWTLFKNVHCRGPCSLRPCISRPYCTGGCYCNSKITIVLFYHNPYLLQSHQFEVS